MHIWYRKQQMEKKKNNKIKLEENHNESENELYEIVKEGPIRDGFVNGYIIRLAVGIALVGL